MRLFIYCFLTPLLYSLFLIHYSPITAAEIPSSLKEAINQKSKELQEINQKILETQKDLGETEGKSRTLRKEIQQNDARIQQLNLSIRSSEINIEKLRLEITDLGGDLEKVRSEMALKKSGIGQLLKEIQKRDNENLLILFLKNKSLAESVSELENLTAINSELANEVGGLRDLNDKLYEKLNLTAEKKQGVEAENRNLKNRQLITENQKKERQTLLAQTKNQEKIYSGQINNLKKLQAEVSAEVEKIEAELRAKIDPSLLPIPRPGVLRWPVTLKENGGLGRLTQKFGLISYLYGGRPHNGLDVGAPIGTPIFAAEKGKVLESWDQDRYCYKGAYGKFIAIEHENNLTTLYAHLSLQTVKKGDWVNRGDLIGYVGQSGYATGPHLHLTLYASQTFIIRESKVNCGPIMPFGGTLDPMQYL